jgi:hypothetical protein
MTSNLNHLLIARSDEPAVDVDEQVNTRASIGDLLESMFHNLTVEIGATLVDHVAACVRDDLEMIAIVSENDCNYGYLTSRIAARAAMWLKIAAQLERRMIEAENAIEQPPPSELAAQSGTIPVASPLQEMRQAQ